MPTVTALTHVNIAVVIGTLINEPTIKVLKSGEEVSSFLVKVNREGEPNTTVPVSWVNPSDLLLEFEVGDELIVCGHVRQQWYSSKERFTDLLATSVVRAGRPSVARKAIASAMIQLQEIAP